MSLLSGFLENQLLDIGFWFEKSILSSNSFGKLVMDFSSCFEKSIQFSSYFSRAESKFKGLFRIFPPIFSYLLRYFVRCHLRGLQFCKNFILEKTLLIGENKNCDSRSKFPEQKCELLKLIPPNSCRYRYAFWIKDVYENRQRRVSVFESGCRVINLFMSN